MPTSSTATSIQYTTITDMSGELINENEVSSADPPKPVRRETNWPLVLFHIYLNMSALYAIFLIFTQARFSTVLFCLLLTVCGTLGITIGCHRLWAHRSYKAAWPLRLVFIIFQTLCCNGPVYDWVQEHRAHHQLRGTDLDKFDHRRGFLFAHILSHSIKLDSRISEAESAVDMSDLEQDQFVMYQKRLYWLLVPVLSLLLPINAPVEYWGESILVSVFVVGFLRVVLLWHAAWLVNSGNVLWGLDPVDRKSSDTILVFFVNKSLWPSYHYLLPWDYKSGEYGTYGSGFSTAILRICAVLGLAYDLSTCTAEGVKNALKSASNNKRPLTECLMDSKINSSLPEILDIRQHSL